MAETPRDQGILRKRIADRLARRIAAGIEPVETRGRWFPAGSWRGQPGFLQIAQDALYALTRRHEPITALFCVEDQVANANRIDSRHPRFTRKYGTAK